MIGDIQNLTGTPVQTPEPGERPAAVDGSPKSVGADSRIDGDGSQANSAPTEGQSVTAGETANRAPSSGGRSAHTVSGNEPSRAVTSRPTTRSGLERAVILNLGPEEALWLRGHLEDEMPGLRDLAETPPILHNSEALRSALLIHGALECVLEVER